MDGQSVPKDLTRPVGANSERREQVVDLGTPLERRRVGPNHRLETPGLVFVDLLL
jgi:hypothetical protein